MTATQRAEVAAFARAWRRESSGLLFVDVPVGVRSTFAVRQTAREVTSVLAAMGVAPELAAGALRFTLGYGTTDADIDRALAVVPATIAALRRRG